MSPSAVAEATEPSFFLSYSDQVVTHIERRNAVLKAHPEVRLLYGPDAFIAWDVSARVVLFTCIAISMASYSWPVLVFVAFAVGGTISHSLNLAEHELSHGMAFQSPFANKLLMLWANFPVGFPSCMAFAKYHSRHHDYLGVYKKDVDIPSLWEGFFFRTKARKFLWLMLQPLFYAVRPFLIDPLPLNEWEIANIFTAVAYDLFLWYAGGWKAVAFMLIGTYLGMTIHPMSGHFLAEHYNFKETFETFSYYGSGNWITYNVGYHVEHHDFRRISYRYLPVLREIASEFYDPIPYHTSWAKVMWDYLMRSDMGSAKRLVRHESYVKELKAILKNQAVSSSADSPADAVSVPGALPAKSPTTSVLSVDE